MVLLGAGASAEAGVPTAVPMTSDLLRYLPGSAQNGIIDGACALITCRVLGALQGAPGVRGGLRDDVSVDIEKLVSTTLEIQWPGLTCG
jgi:hypothetical protein